MTHTISTVEAVERAGCTYRQLDHWINSGIFPGEQSPGTGNYRSIPESLVPRISAVARVSDALTIEHSRCSLEILRAVVDNFSQGYIILGDGIQIQWAS